MTLYTVLDTLASTIKVTVAKVVVASFFSFFHLLNVTEFPRCLSTLVSSNTWSCQQSERVMSSELLKNSQGGSWVITFIRIECPPVI